MQLSSVYNIMNIGLLCGMAFLTFVKIGRRSNINTKSYDNDELLYREIDRVHKSIELSLDGLYTPDGFIKLYEIIIEAAYLETLAEKQALTQKRLQALAASDLKTWDDCYRRE
jgi:hypothetical protein